jgi:hypothetical protein
LAKADNVLTATANAGLQLPYPSGQGVRMDNVLTLDGARGEGGGQILRTALSLSAITTRAFRLVNLRAGRRNPGLLPQHLSAVRAAAAVTDAVVSGDRLASIELRFSPQRPAKAGSYAIDVAETAERGSAGSVTLILQTPGGGHVHTGPARRYARRMVATVQ